MAVKVVNISIKKKQYTHYIGRPWAGIPESPFHNPFHMFGNTRADIILKFIAYWYASEQKQLRQTALILIPEDSVLGCWCRPFDCHGDTIAAYLNWKRQEHTLW
jgi:hypothetical protein